MRIARDGIPFVLAVVLAAAGAWLAGWTLAALILLGVAGFVAFFFRDPEREPPSDEDAVLAPGDGRVVAAENDGDRFRLSIFLSLFDVHVNRSPIAGLVRAVDHRPGRFRAAFRDQASEANEQTRIVVAGDRGTVTFKQIAGLVARRIVCRVKPGQTVRAGERVGLIRFGSRIDVVLPPGAAPTVGVGDRVRGGVTVVGRLTGTERS
jgi:phosphatidylserine decarboxylase